jgi:exodeoxyribonuclease VII small subunit
MPESQPIDELTYEQAFEELEAIVDALEAGDRDLDASLALFERGQALADRCGQLLSEAELKLNELSQLDDSSALEKPVESKGV